MYYATDLLEALKKIDVNVTSFGMGFAKIDKSDDATAAMIGILRLYEFAIEEVELAALSLPVKERQMERLLASKDAFFEACRQGQFAQFQSVFKLETEQAKIEGVIDALETSGFPERVPLNRVQFTEDTLSLKSKVMASDIPEYAKRAAEIKLEALLSLLAAGEQYSDERIRIRVKAIYADFCAEFEAMDKEYRTVLDMVKGWARPIMRGGILALALTADVQTVSGLLEFKGD